MRFLSQNSQETWRTQQGRERVILFDSHHELEGGSEVSSIWKVNAMSFLFCLTWLSDYILFRIESKCSQVWYLDSKKVSIPMEAVLPTLPMLYLLFNVYLDSKTVNIFIEAVLPTLPMLYLPFNVYLDSKRESILIETVLPTLPMLYLPFNVYIDSKRVSIFIEAVLPTLQLLYLPLSVYLDSKTVNILGISSVAEGGGGSCPPARILLLLVGNL